MRELRKLASSRFLLDYQAHPERYVSGTLPRLPFADDSFDLTLVSYFLFAYQDQLSYEFHRDSILEIMRVTPGGSAHLSNCDLRSATESLPSLTWIGPGPSRFRIYGDKNRLRVSAQFQLVFAGQTDLAKSP
jgi:hypothetical protein